MIRHQPPLSPLPPTPTLATHETTLAPTTSNITVDHTRVNHDASIFIASRATTAPASRSTSPTQSRNPMPTDPLANPMSNSAPDRSTNNAAGFVAHPRA